MPCHYLDGELASADRARSCLVKGAPRVVDRRITATAAANANANAARRRPSIIVGLSFRAYTIYTYYYRNTLLLLLCRRRICKYFYSVRTYKMAYNSHVNW